MEETPLPRATPFTSTVVSPVVTVPVALVDTVSEHCDDGVVVIGNSYDYSPWVGTSWIASAGKPASTASNAESHRGR